MLRFRSASKPSVFTVEGQRPKTVLPRIQRSAAWTALVENCRQGATVTLKPTTGAVASTTPF
jgi:hypothetical protein